MPAELSPLCGPELPEKASVGGSGVEIRAMRRSFYISRSDDKIAKVLSRIPFHGISSNQWLQLA